MSRANGGWVNDVSLSSWQGITVFHAIALAEALDIMGRSWMRCAEAMDGQAGAGGEVSGWIYHD